MCAQKIIRHEIVLLWNFFPMIKNYDITSAKFFTQKKNNSASLEFFTHLIFMSLITEFLYCNTGESTFAHVYIITNIYHEV